MFKHRDAKDFKCDICDAAYVHKRDLVSILMALNLLYKLFYEKILIKYCLTEKTSLEKT